MFPLSFQQQGIWFLSELKITNANWNLVGIKIFSGRFRTDLMPRVAKELLKRHEALRTIIRVVDFEPYQQVLELDAIDCQDIFSYQDLTSLPKEVSENTAFNLYKNDAITTRFDLSRPPLFKIKVIRVHDNKLLIYLLMNHVVADNQSLGIIWRDLVEIYNAFVSGEKITGKITQITHATYRDFAQQQNEKLTQGLFAEAEAYWRSQFAAPISRLNLLTDFPPPR